MTPCPYPGHPPYRSATHAKAIRQGMRMGRQQRVIRCGGHAHLVMNATDHTSRILEGRMTAEPIVTTLRDRITEALYSSRRNGLGGMTEAEAVAHMADAVLAALPGVGPAADREAHPPSSRWAVETYDPGAEEWAPGSRYPDKANALERYLGISSTHRTWRDGTPVQRRIVRETTTHTVEPTP